MSAKELSIPVSGTNIPVPATTDTVVLTFGTPGTVQQRSLSDPAYSPAGESSVFQSGAVVLRGIIVLTGNATAGTVTVKCKRNGGTQVDSNMSQPVTLAANEVKVIPFEFTDGPNNPYFGNQWYYTITVNPTQAGTVNKAYGHFWAEG